MTAANANFLQRWVLDASQQRRLAFLLAAAAIVSGISTVAFMTDPAALQERADLLQWMLIIDGILLVMLSIVVARRIMSLFTARRSGRTGAGLQGRLVMLFALIAVTPAILVALFSYLFLNFGLEAWFNQRVSKALADSVGVTQAYLQEHRENIANQALSLAFVLDQNAPTLMRSPWNFNRVLTSNASLRELQEAVVIDRVGNIIARSDFALTTELEEIPSTAFENAENGEIAVVQSEKIDKVRALIKLNRFVGAYLLVEKFVDPRVLQHITVIRDAFDDYKQLEAARSGVQISFVLIYMIAVMILVMAAIWIGMTVSAQVAEPVTKLIGAADRVSKGDLTARVEETGSRDEIGVLSRAFNNMTQRIDTQQKGLMAANTELDERRRFTETVLEGVSAGVIGLDETGKINLPNRSASDLLGIPLIDMIDKGFADVVPEASEIFDKAVRRPERLQQSEIKVTRDQNEKTLLIRVAGEHVDGRTIGFVVTFDDVTDLLSAQRKAAWADVARRIAHEIKNPLTPIQLSAERLSRKYKSEISSDPETFRKLTETIVRQVSDIGRMVDEFSSFARMPQPSIRLENISEICREAVFLEQNRDPEIAFGMSMPDEDIMIACDARQISRVLTNVLKNSAESIEAARAEGAPDVEGQVNLVLDHINDGEGIVITVEDDGRGLPSDDRARLTEPYVTTRDKGTGLGLAIVKKIVEEHGGMLGLHDRAPRGAQIKISLPVGNVLVGQSAVSGGEKSKIG